MRDEEAFTAYVRVRWVPMVRSLVLLGCSRHDAEDLVQTALAKCFTSWDRIQRAEDVDAYVYRTLLNTWASSRRRRWWGELPSEQQPPDDPGPDELEIAALRLVLSQALSGLSEDHRRVLVLRYVADLTETQVAAALGLAVGTVKSRVSRAIERIDLDVLREATS